MLSKCATACVTAAIDLTHLVHETYQTSAADAWWYNGFYISTAAILLLMSISAPSMLDRHTMAKARGAWREATTVLGEMATYSRSASNTLQFLQAAYRQADQQQQQQSNDNGSDNTQSSPHVGFNFNNNNDNGRTTQLPFFNWEEFAAEVGPGVGLDDLGFLTRVDFDFDFANSLG
ncbi:hypothetical protein BJY01DRAFT_241656 [Aspergillus pseudoustus]|uniref:Uncharacterized protein n=1 Tax=Aspergillus pseudoustus TaxID=1810923 RepID=A0ABR4IAD6_9EURO